jgi:hypothetical protein
MVESGHAAFGKGAAVIRHCADADAFPKPIKKREWKKTFLNSPITRIEKQSW